MRFLATLILCLFSFAAHAASFDKIVIFGDSLSDNGNIYTLSGYTIPKNPPYYQGRFTNGKVWVEELAKRLNLSPDAKSQFADYAYGGAWGSDETPADAMALVNLSWEISEFLSMESMVNAQRTLFIIWVGGNDYLNGRYDTSPEAATNETVNSIERSMNTLIKKGARHILVLNLPDLGTTPGANTAELAKRLTQLTQLHNKKLATMLANQSKNYPELKVYAFDVTPHFNDVLVNPAKYHLTNLKDACYDGDYGSLDGNDNNQPFHLCANPNEYMYWDNVHPSETIHLTLGKLVAEFLPH